MLNLATRYVLLWHGPRTTFAAGETVRNGYRVAAGYLSFLLFFYPLTWALTKGGNIITVTAEMIWFGILDVLARPVFLFFFLSKLHDVDYTAFGLQSGKYTDAETGRVNDVGEKRTDVNGVAQPHGNGVAGTGPSPANNSAQTAGANTSAMNSGPDTTSAATTSSAV